MICRRFRSCQVFFGRKELKRVKHVVGENIAKQINRSFYKQDILSAGKCLFENHESLSELFEISCEETDFLVCGIKKKKKLLEQE